MKCKLCGRKKFNLLFTKSGFFIERCKNCRLVRTRGDVQKQYNEYHREEDYKKYENMFRNIFQKRYKIISDLKNTGKVLEIGSATGNLLAIFKKNGWEVLGVEPSGNARVAKKRGVPTKKTTFEKVQLPKDYFDAVVINHTLEHLDNPLGVLKKVKTVLKKGGIAYIDVPNFDSLSARLAGKKWKYLLPTEHVHHFEPKTLEKLVKKAGLRVKTTKTWSGIFDVASPFMHFYFLIKNKNKKIISDALHIPSNIVSTLLDRGTNLVVIGEK